MYLVITRGDSKLAEVIEVISIKGGIAKQYMYKQCIFQHTIFIQC